MLVDPNTGMPVETDTPESLLGGALSAQSASAGALSAVGQQAGFFGPGSIPDAALDAVPGLSQTTAWNTFRGSRTIAYGGKGVNQISGFRATMSPRFLTRLPSMEALGGSSAKTANYAFRASKYVPGESYTPFNILARAGNSIVGGKYGIGTIARKGLVMKARETGSMTSARNLANQSAIGRFQLRMADYSRQGPAFSVGAFSRITAADKMARGKLPVGNVTNFLQATDSKLANSYNLVTRQAQNIRNVGNMMPGVRSMPLTPMTAAAQADDAVRMTYASVNGSISGRVSGFMAQMRLGQAGELGQKAAVNAGKEFFVAGTEAAQRFMTSGGFQRVGGNFIANKGSFFAEKMGVKVGEKIGAKTAVQAMAKKGGMKAGAKLGAALAVNAVPIAGQIVSAVLLADLAMDVGKLGVEVFKSGVDFAKDAAISYKGSINKGVMGMGYRDNTVAATSRARGVQAIQNSRLNARSVLGSEAGAMHAHFG